MSKLATTLALALLVASPAAFADRFDTSAEVNVNTPDITTPGEDYSTYQTPRTVSRTTTTTYTSTTRRGVGQAVMGDGKVFRPYRTYTRVIDENSVPVVTESHTTTYSSPEDSMTIEQEANMLLNDMGEPPIASETVVIHQ